MHSFAVSGATVVADENVLHVRHYWTLSATTLPNPAFRFDLFGTTYSYYTSYTQFIMPSDPRCTMRLLPSHNSSLKTLLHDYKIKTSCLETAGCDAGMSIIVNRTESGQSCTVFMDTIDTLAIPVID